MSISLVKPEGQRSLVKAQPGQLSNLVRMKTLSNGKLEDDHNITMNQVDNHFCKILYCTSCFEIYHDRNFPVNLPTCTHMMCQHCIKFQLMKQIQSFEKNSKKDQQKQFKITCQQCAASKTFDTLDNLQSSVSYNYEVLALIYKHREKVAEKAIQLYDLPKEDKTSIDLLQVTKFAISNDLKEKLDQEKRLLQKLNYVFIQQQRQQNLLSHLREEVVCFKCFKGFDEKERQPLIMTGCQHKICNSCYQKFFKDEASITCLFCGEDRIVKEVSKPMQRWLIHQGKKKKIVIKSELEEIQNLEKPKLKQLEKILSGGKQKEHEEEKKQDDGAGFGKGPGSYAKKPLGSGMIQGKQEIEDDEGYELIDLAQHSSIQFQRIQRLNTYKVGLSSADKRQIFCSSCGVIFCKFNRPILLQQCPCKVIHQECENCFKTQSLQQSGKNKGKFKIECPITFQKKLLNIKAFKLKEQLFEHLLDPKSRGEIIKVNHNLLTFIYEKHKDEARDGEKDFAEGHGIELEQEEKKFAANRSDDSEDEKDGIGEEWQENQRGRIRRKTSPNKLKNQQNIMDDIEKQKHCSQCNYDFERGQKTPALLNCGHNICTNCLEILYNDDSAFEENELQVKCIYDGLVSCFLKPAFFGDNDNNKADFLDFCNASVCINTGLLQLLIKASQKSAEQMIPAQRKAQPFNYYNIDEEIDLDELIVEEQKKQDEDDKKVQKKEDVGTTGTGGTKSDVMYDIECPICMLCFSNDNPPINLHCKEHPQYPFVLCRNEMLYYFTKAGHDKDMNVSCPICHNEITYQTKGKTEEQFFKLLDVNQNLLNTIYSDKNLIQYVKNEEAQLKYK